MATFKIVWMLAQETINGANYTYPFDMVPEDKVENYLAARFSEEMNGIPWVAHRSLEANLVEYLTDQGWTVLNSKEEFDALK